jgi:hypothetical protein
MTALVDHSRDHDLTVQGNQAARSRALTHLLEIPGLPTVSLWSIDAALNYLYGMVLPASGQSPDKQRQTVKAWAAHLHIDVEETTVADVVTVAADGPCEWGVRVRIYAQIPAAIKEAA